VLKGPPSKLAAPGVTLDRNRLTYPQINSSLQETEGAPYGTCSRSQTNLLTQQCLDVILADFLTERVPKNRRGRLEAASNVG
jgi:hypothetical protein